MKKMTLVVCVIMLLAIASAAFSQGLDGKKELELAAAWADIADLSATLLLANGGQFVNPNLEISATLIYAKVEDLKLWAIGPTAVYHFIPSTPSSTIPYVGAGFYFADASNGGSESNFDWQALVGVKSFMGGDYTESNRAWFAEFRYIHNILDTDENISSILVGIANYF